MNRAKLLCAVVLGGALMLMTAVAQRTRQRPQRRTFNALEYWSASQETGERHEASSAPGTEPAPAVDGPAGTGDGTTAGAPAEGPSKVRVARPQTWWTMT